MLAVAAIICGTTGVALKDPPPTLTQGPTGPDQPGPTGPTGPSGAIFSVSSTGPTGMVGVGGDTGDPNLGAQTGQTGPTGPVGLQGDSGIMGPTGLYAMTGGFGLSTIYAGTTAFGTGPAWTVMGPQAVGFGGSMGYWSSGPITWDPQSPAPSPGGAITLDLPFIGTQAISQPWPANIVMSARGIGSTGTQIVGRAIPGMQNVVEFIRTDSAGGPSVPLTLLDITNISGDLPGGSAVACTYYPTQ